MSETVGFSNQISLKELMELSAEQLNKLPFGVVKMAKDGTVQAVNTAEIELAGLSLEAFLGKNFFTQVAPCTNNYMVAEKYRRLEELDESIAYVFTYMMRPTPVRLRMLKSAAYDSQFLLVDRTEPVSS